MSWTPARTLAQTEAILCAPGHLHEVETILLDGRPQRVYKHLWPTVRAFWLSSVEKHANKTCIVFEGQRFTYNEVHQRAIKVAAVFRHVYGINKERADRLIPVADDILRDTTATGFLVFDNHEGSHRWPGMNSFPAIVEQYHEGIADILAADPQILPEDNAAIMFTSGTTGLPKGVLSTQRQFLTNVFNVMVGGLRASLRKGEEYPDFKDDIPQKAILIAVPLFHVTGTTSFAMMATATGMKIVLTPKWVVEDVPAMVADLTGSSLPGHLLDGLLFGGSPAPDTLVPRARKAFPSAVM
ncbi:hypothetical protein DXG03_001494 [Asterophora parasitica]|uniref:AMP-dependent synthetase/ligase domain-containing protein n=1 Tax=Asterophora parasitica TaxID=117018 RepID=A0A9P7G3G7_9AGAR|nr:hypothetical protein DXG03_001494 [Asterophora parasitica]